MAYPGRGKTGSPVDAESDETGRSTADGSQRAPDREFDELVGELRVVLPSVTVIFAFLLTVPFTTSFGSIRGVDRASYFVAFIATGLAVILLVAETRITACSRRRMTRKSWFVLQPGRR